ncbi:diguanylate cyclase [Massilia sp. FT127W]|uniref:Diguanylate cyclase n=1 Tax=Pseudoduganella aquatica TaxID=2660641 RepID=A0A7X4HH94_9BURK|nr:diguanylate cyclase [Pseudoduganella aquatica]
METALPQKPQGDQLIRSDNPVRRFLRKTYRAVLLPAFALGLLLSMWGAVAYQVRQEYHSARHEAVLHSQTLARTLAEHTSHLLRQTEHATQLFKLKYEETGGTLRLPEFTRKGGLLDSLMPSRLELPIALYLPDGKLLESRNGFFSPDISADPMFKILGLALDDAALASNPMVEPKTKKWQIQIARRLNDAKGQFAGVIMLMVDPAYFVEDYDRLHVEPNGLVMLTSRDTGLAIGRIEEHLYISDAIDFTTTSTDAYGSADELTLKQPLDGVERIYSYRDMPRYSLTAVVGNTVSSSMVRFENQRRIYFVLATLASMLVCAFAALLMQQSRRLRRSMLAATEAQQKLRAAADASLDAVFLLKACRSHARGEVVDFTLVDVNERGARMLELPRDTLLGQRIGELVPNWRKEGFLDRYRAVMETGQPLEEEFETRNLPGEPRWLRHQIVAIDDGVTVTTRNITSRKRDELKMRQNQAELQAVNDASPLGLIRADANGHCTYVNRTFEAITGLTREQALGDAWMVGVHPNDREVLSAAIRHLRDTLQPFQDTLRCVHPDGKVVWTSMKVAPIIIDGRIDGFVGTLDDITLMRKSVMALRESEARLRTITDTLPAMIAYVDEDEVYRFNNLAYEREFSQSGVGMVGRTIRETVGEERYQYLQPYVQRALAGETLSFEEDDESHSIVRSFEVIYIPQFDEGGYSVVGFHVMRQDITAQKREKQRLLKLSQIDALTGLTNRAGFLQELNNAMAASRDNNTMMAVMYMDIDRFKPVNDTYGHSVGDSLLKVFSARLTHAMRASDTIARLGGDEFTIIVERLARTEDAENLAAKIVTTMQAPFELDAATVSVSTSIGLTFYQGEEVTPAELLNRADMLLYQAKQAGRNTYRAAPVLSALHATPNAA